MLPYLLVAFSLIGAEAQIKAPVSVQPGDLVVLDASGSKGANFAWTVIPERTHLVVEDGQKCVFASGTPGVYTFVVAVGDAESVSQTKHVLIVAGTTPPAPPPGPEPGPTPDPAPPPAEPSPWQNATGFRAVFVYPAHGSLSASQQSIITGKRVREYLDSKTVKVDGRPQYLMWKSDENVDDVADAWRNAYQRAKGDTWYVVANGAAWEEGPLPQTVDEMLAILKKYGGD